VVLGGDPPFARPLERGKTLAQLLDHGDLLAECPARDVAPSLCLAGEDVGDVWIDFWSFRPSWLRLS
jgi:hypothetical protein